jgi:hypothetical protein
VPSRSRVVAWVTTLAGDHGRRCEALIAAIPLGVLVGHSVLWTLGRMASNGEPRYMLIVAPFWALLAAAGWRRLHAVLPALTPGRLALAAAAVPVAANLAYPAFPLKAQAHDRLAIRVTEALRDEGESLHRRYPRITSSLPHLYMRLDLDRLDDTRVADPSQRTALDPPRGVQYLWDDIYSTHNSNELYCVTEKMLTDHGWVPSKTFIEENRRLILFLSPLDVDGRPSIPPSTADAPATTP